MYTDSPYKLTHGSGRTLDPQGAGLAIAEWTAPGTPEGTAPEWIAPLHLHREDDEAWIVLEGSLSFRIGEAEVTAHANETVLVPRGTPHTYWNPAPGTARYLIVMPHRIRDLIAAIHAAQHRDAASMRQLFRQFASEWLD